MLCFLLPALLSLQGCWPFDTSPNGFDVFANTIVDNVSNGGDAGVSVGGIRQSNIIADGFGYLAGAPGSVTTGDDGHVHINHNFYGTWYLERGGDSQFPDGLCPRIGSFFPVVAGGSYGLTCDLSGSISPDPDPFNIAAPTPTISFTGAAASAQYRMPIIRFYTDTGNLISSATVSSISSDGTQLQIATPPELSSIYSGTYGAIIYVVNADGSLSPVSGTRFDAIGNDAPPPPPDDNGCPNREMECLD